MVAVAGRAAVDCMSRHPVSHVGAWYIQLLLPLDNVHVTSSVRKSNRVFVYGAVEADECTFVGSRDDQTNNK
jgi:hypothetical protein